MVDARQRAAGAFVAERVSPEDWGRIADWDDVVADSAAPAIFLTRDWVSAWWDAFGAGLDPYLLRLADADDRTAGIGPLYLERLRSGGGRLGLLGDRVVGSEYLGLIARAHAEDVAQTVAAWLAADGRVGTLRS